MRRPYVFKSGERWAIRFVLDGRATLWFTERHADALAFALNLARLREAGLTRV